MQQVVEAGTAFRQLLRGQVLQAQVITGERAAGDGGQAGARGVDQAAQAPGAVRRRRRERRQRQQQGAALQQAEGAGREFKDIFQQQGRGEHGAGQQRQGAEEDAGAGDGGYGGQGGHGHEYGRASLTAAAQQVAVGVNPPVAQERPFAAQLLAAPEIDLRRDYRGAVGRRLRQDLPLRPGDEAGAPEARAAAVRLFPLQPGAVAGCHRQAVGDRMAALHGQPGVGLAAPFGLRLRRVPADGAGVEQQFGSCQGHQAGRLREPLVPTDQYAQAAQRGLDGAEAVVAGGEVIFFVVAGFFGYMHLAVAAGQRPVAVQRHRRVVIQPALPALEDGGDDDDPEARRLPSQAFGGRSRHRFRQVEAPRFLAHAKVGQGGQFGQQCQFGAAPPRLRQPGGGRPLVGLAVFAAVVLRDGQP